MLDDPIGEARQDWHALLIEKIQELGRNGQQPIADGLFHIIQALTGYRQLPTERLTGGYRCSAKFLAEFRKDDFLSAGNIAMLHHGRNAVFLPLGECHPNPRQGRDTRDRVIQGFAKLDSRILGVPAHLLGQIECGYRRLGKDILADVRKGQQHRLSGHVAGIMRRLQHIDRIGQSRLGIHRFGKDAAKLIFEEAEPGKDHLTTGKGEGLLEHAADTDASPVRF